MSTDVISFIGTVCFDFYAHQSRGYEKKKKKDLVVILSRGRAGIFFFFFITSKEMTQSHFYENKKALFLCLCTSFDGNMLKLTCKPGCLMLRCISDRMFHLFVKSRRMKEHLWWATVRGGTPENTEMHDARAAFTRDVRHIILILNLLQIFLSFLQPSGVKLSLHVHADFIWSYIPPFYIFQAFFLATQSKTTNHHKV